MTPASQLNLQMRHVLKTQLLLMTQLTPPTLTLTFSQITISGQTTIGGGYGSTGVTLSADGDLSMDGNAVVDGSITLGGGYGSTGVTISAAGAISADGPNYSPGGISVSGGTATTTTADINGGAIDGTAIGASSHQQWRLLH